MFGFFDVFSSIFGIIAVAIQFVLNLITSFLNFILKIPQMVLLLTNSFQLVPAIFLPFLTISISMSILLFLINRRS